MGPAPEDELRSYNGFTATERMTAYRWLMAEYAAGRRMRPVACDACTQTAGLIEPHSEDYSSPFGPHIGQWGVCYTCHMMIHCRFKALDRWDEYRSAVRAGAIFAPIAKRAFPVFAGRFLRGPLPMPERYRESVPETLLDLIEHGELRPTDHVLEADMIETLPALSLWQPWASLIAIGAKPFETRGRCPPRRLIGRRIAIHAAGRKPRLADLDGETFEAMCEAFGYRRWLEALPRGAVVCTALLVEGLPVERVPHDLFGDFSPGRWAWRLDDVRAVEPPVPARGQQVWGWVWHVPEGVMP